jgi:hypothetical protein
MFLKLEFYLKAFAGMFFSVILYHHQNLFLLPLSFETDLPSTVIFPSASTSTQVVFFTSSNCVSVPFVKESEL